MCSPHHVPFGAEAWSLPPTVMPVSVLAPGNAESNAFLSLVRGTQFAVLCLHGPYSRQLTIERRTPTSTGRQEQCWGTMQDFHCVEQFQPFSNSIRNTEYIALALTMTAVQLATFDPRRATAKDLDYTTRTVRSGVSFLVSGNGLNLRSTDATSE